MNDDDTTPIRFDGTRYFPEIKYPLTQEDWERIKIRCGFQTEKETLAREAIEYILDEFIQREIKPPEFQSLATSLKEILTKIQDLSACIHEQKNDPEIYEVLIDDDSGMMPASFADGEGSDHAGHQNLLGFIDTLDVLSNRIEDGLNEFPKSHRKNDARALKRLVASYDRIVTKCSNRRGIQRSGKLIGDVNDLMALQEICSVARKHSNKFFSEDSIDAAMRRPIAVREGKTDQLSISDARMIEPSALFRLVLNGGQFESAESNAAEE